MGMGVNLICNQCHEEEPLLLGCGFSSFMNGLKNVVFVCKRCGYWETTEVPFDKKDIERGAPGNDDIAENESKVMCPTCKIRMKKYDRYYKQNDEPLIPKMVCKKCGGLLEGHGNICWD